MTQFASVWKRKSRLHAVSPLRSACNTLLFVQDPYIDPITDEVKLVALSSIAFGRLRQLNPATSITSGELAVLYSYMLHGTMDEHETNRNNIIGLVFAS
jgi:hypothetical protein